MIETKEQKEKRLFDIYKNDLIKLASDKREVRFICVQYVCQYPKIDPYIMAASLIKSGIKIVYDNSTISLAENRKAERKVSRLLSEKGRKEEWN